MQDFIPEKRRVKIKICGLTEEKEAEYLKKNHVDFAGMVLFFEKSRRCITVEKAKKIMASLGDSIKSVAVVVSPSLGQVKEIEDAGFDCIQIHGELNREIIEKCSIPILKAFNISDLGSFAKYQKCEKVAGYVFDAAVPGSGETYDYSLINALPRDNKLFMLAGGLKPDNVIKAIEAVRPDAVDVSTGVEYEEPSGILMQKHKSSRVPAGKDPEKIDSFCHNVSIISGSF